MSDKRRMLAVSSLSCDLEYTDQAAVRHFRADPGAMTSATVYADPALLIFVPILLLILPLRWSIAAVLAALIHELAHLIFVSALGGTVHEIRIGLQGTVIHATAVTPLSDCLSILAGPLLSLLLYSLRSRYPELAFCGLAQGIYNLIPVFPLDGGRLLYRLFCLTVPDRSDRLMKYTGFICIVLLLGSITASVYHQNWTELYAEIPLLFFLLQKTLANRTESRYNSNTIF